MSARVFFESNVIYDTIIVKLCDFEKKVTV